MLIRLLAGAAAALLVSTAQAADLPAYEAAPAIAVSPSFTWTGAYLGLQAGYGWGDIGGAKPDGFAIGGYAGYNLQFDGSPIVIGVETDINYSDADSRRGLFKFDTRWNGATRARAGFAFDRFLVYAAGGVAYSDTRLRAAGLKDSQTAIGWTAGAGVEGAVTENIILRSEYRYSDYGSERYTLGRASARGSLSEHRWMGGVAYKFDLW